MTTCDTYGCARPPGLRTASARTASDAFGRAPSVNPSGCVAHTRAAFPREPRADCGGSCDPFSATARAVAALSEWHLPRV